MYTSFQGQIWPRWGEGATETAELWRGEKIEGGSLDLVVDCGLRAGNGGAGFLHRLTGRHR